MRVFCANRTLSHHTLSEPTLFELHNFAEQVLRKRPYLSGAMCEAVVRAPLRTEVQSDGRLRHWGRVILPGEQKARILRVVTLDDGRTLHNAFIGRDFREDQP